MCRGKDYGVGTLVAEERCGGNRVEQIQLGMCACDKVLEPASLQIGHNGRAHKPAVAGHVDF